MRRALDKSDEGDDAFEWIMVPHPTSQPTNLQLETVISDEIAISFNVTQQIHNCSDGSITNMENNESFISKLYERCGWVYEKAFIDLSNIHVLKNISQICDISYTVTAYVLPNFLNTQNAYLSIIECLNSTKVDQLVEVSHFNTRILMAQRKTKLSMDLTLILVCSFFSLMIVLLITGYSVEHKLGEDCNSCHQQQNLVRAEDTDLNL